MGYQERGGPNRNGREIPCGSDLINSFNPFNHASVDFDTVDVSGFESVSISFDYEVSGFDVGDNIFYTLTFDGTAGPEVQLIDGGDDLTVSDLLTLPVPDGTSTVALQIRMVQDGGDDFLGFDNFVVEGTVGSVPEPSSALLVAITSGLSLVRRRRC